RGGTDRSTAQARRPAARRWTNGHRRDAGARCIDPRPSRAASKTPSGSSLVAGFRSLVILLTRPASAVRDARTGLERVVLDDGAEIGSQWERVPTERRATVNIFVPFSPESLAGK